MLVKKNSVYCMSHMLINLLKRKKNYLMFQTFNNPIDYHKIKIFKKKIN